MQVEGIDTTMILAKNFYLTSVPDIATRPETTKRKRRQIIMKAGFSFSVLLILLVAGAFNVYGQGQTLNPASQIALNAQGDQGQFNGPDLSVNYAYVINGGNMLLTGNVQFGMTIQANYAGVQTFQLGLALADGQGNVLGQQQITSAFYNNLSDTIKFNTSVAVPPQAAFMAFSYSGQASAAGSGGPDPTNIRFSPFAN